MKKLNKIKIIVFALALVAMQFTVGVISPKVSACTNPGAYGICPPSTGIVITDHGIVNDPNVQTSPALIIVGVIMFVGLALIVNGIIVRRNLRSAKEKSKK